MRLFRPIPDDNAPRFEAAKQHVESWFWRANDPENRRAIWIKATILKPTDGPPMADVWCIHFDGDTVTGRRETVPLGTARFAGEPLDVEIAGARFTLDGGRGQLVGSIDELTWDLRFESIGGAIGAPLCLMPSRRLLVAPLPKFKLVTPLPALSFSGTIKRGNTTWQVADWTGSQGHNWGPEHSEEYAWSQCLFPGSDGPAVLVEGASARIRIAGRLTPWLSVLVVRRGAQEWRFDRLVDTWNHELAFGDVGDELSWVLRMRGPDGEALLKVSAHTSQMACLGYRNPNGRLSYCMNSKLSKVTLRDSPRVDDAFECHSEHSGALEFLRTEPDVRLGTVI